MPRKNGKICFTNEFSLRRFNRSGDDLSITKPPRNIFLFMSHASIGVSMNSLDVIFSSIPWVARMGLKLPSRAWPSQVRGIGGSLVSVCVIEFPAKASLRKKSFSKVVNGLLPVLKAVTLLAEFFDKNSPN